jgi:arylsulfatase A-like enzyme
VSSGFKHKIYNYNETRMSAESAKKSIVLVTVDCLRADHVGFMGYDRPTTPFLDTLAAESLVFPAAIAAGAPTYYSFPAILASRFPLALGRDILGLAPGEPTLASVLKNAGYATTSFGAANPYISSRFGYAHGFDTFHDFLDDEPAPLSDVNAVAPTTNGWANRLNRNLQKINSKLGPLSFVYDEIYFQYCQRTTPTPPSLDALRRFPAADVLVDAACAWLTSIGDAPFFLWLHLMDPHSPYYPKEDALSLMQPDSVTPFRARYLNSFWNRSDLSPHGLSRYRDEIIALYDAGIRWVDVQMARLVEAMRQSRQWDNSIFAFTADHGEEFLDHGGRYHPPSRLMEELIHVPLLLRVPGTAKQEIANEPFSLLHLAPTLLEAAQLSVPSEFQGRSYWRHRSDPEAIAISECVADCTNPFHSQNRLGPRVLSVRETRFKLVLHFNPPAEYLYDLEADPGERSPLSLHVEKPVRRRLLEVAREHLLRSAHRANRVQRSRLQARLREFQLEWKTPTPRLAASSQLTAGHR